MAAIRIDNSNDLWFGSARVFRYIVSDLVTTMQPSRMDQRLFMALNDGSWYLDLSDLDEEERRQVKRSISELTVRLQQSGRSAFSDPAVYDGFLSRLTNFERMVSETWKSDEASNRKSPDE